MINALLQKIRRLVSLGVLTNDKMVGNIKFVQVQLGENFTADDIEHLEQFGFTGRALNGADAVVVSKGGNRDDMICLMTHDRKYRIEIARGEAAVYNQHGDWVHLRNDRTIHVKTPVRVHLETDLVECSNDLLVKGNAHINGDTRTDGNNDVGGDNSVTGDNSIGGNNAVTGTTSAAGASFAGAMSCNSATIGGEEHSEHKHNYDTDKTTSGVI